MPNEKIRLKTDERILDPIFDNVVMFRFTVEKQIINTTSGSDIRSDEYRHDVNYCFTETKYNSMTHEEIMYELNVAIKKLSETLSMEEQK